MYTKYDRISSIRLRRKHLNKVNKAEFNPESKMYNFANPPILLS